MELSIFHFGILHLGIYHMGRKQSRKGYLRIWIKRFIAKDIKHCGEAYKSSPENAA